MAPTGVSTWRQHASPYHSMELSLVTGRRRAKPCGLRNSIRFRTSQRRLFGLPFWEIKPRCIHQVHLSALLLSIRSCYIHSSPHAKNWDWFAGGSIRPGPLHLAGRAGLCPCERATRPTHPRGIRGSLACVRGLRPYAQWPCIGAHSRSPHRNVPSPVTLVLPFKVKDIEKKNVILKRFVYSSQVRRTFRRRSQPSRKMSVPTVCAYEQSVFWSRGSQALIKSPVRELWAGARIVYCRSLSYNSFALGLELLTAARKDKI